MMTSTETITRLCELVAEIEEIRTNTEVCWVGYDLHNIGEKLQDMIQTMQEQKVMKKPYVTIKVPLNGSVLRRLNMCKEKGLTMNEISAISVLHDIYDDFAFPIYDAWLKQSKGRPEPKTWNNSLRGYIRVNRRSASETAYWGSKNPATLPFITEHFNEVLRYAVKKEESVPRSGQSKGFSKIIILEREIKGVGTAKLTVGVRPDGEMMHYCITAGQGVEAMA